MNTQVKKCLVLDLDNTLWGGVVGEDGVEGIRLSLTPPGNHFIAFQQAILDVYNKGVILAINSRNNENDALEVFRTHPNMILKEHHFAASRMNWNDKAQNIQDLAKELNIGTDSMVFIDDDPTNRDLVRALLPEVVVPELPADSREYTKFFNSLNYFDSSVTTDEDRMRGNLYVTERLRKEQEKVFENKEDFLKSLGLELRVFEDDATALSRLAQLTEKTNQFNVFKKPMTEEEIKSYIADTNFGVFHGHLQDTFGDYGIVIFAVIEKKPDIWNIKSLLMSCRVFGRGVENAFFALLLERAREEGINTISIAYEETPKNAPARAFIDTYFTDYKHKIPDTITRPYWINLIK